MWLLFLFISNLEKKIKITFPFFFLAFNLENSNVDLVAASQIMLFFPSSSPFLVSFTHFISTFEFKIQLCMSCFVCYFVFSFQSCNLFLFFIFNCFISPLVLTCYLYEDIKWKSSQWFTRVDIFSKGILSTLSWKRQQLFLWNKSRARVYGLSLYLYLALPLYSFEDFATFLN